MRTITRSLAAAALLAASGAQAAETRPTIVGITVGAFDVSAQGADVTVMTNNVQVGKRPEPAVVLLDTKLVTKDDVATYKGWDAAR